MTNRRNSRSAVTLLPSPMIALAVGVLCVAYIQLSYSASIPRSGRSSSTSTTTSGTKTPSRITSLRTGKSKPHLEVQAGRMKASDIKACISKAFCEVNSASKMPNYAVNKEFFDLMNQIHALSGEDLEIDSGSTSVEYDDDEDEDDDDVSSEESSSERLRGYPPPPPPPPGYRRGRELLLANGTTIAVNGSDIGSSTPTATVSTTLKKVKDKSKSKDKKGKKSKGKKKTSGQKMVKKFVNGTLVSVPKRRSRVETKEEKAEKQDFVNRKQREMGQVNDLAALIRISADIGLTLRSPRKCRTLFNKCTMSHEQIVDLFNQTLLAVTTPSSSSPQPSSVPTTKRAKVTTTLAAAVSSADTPTLSSSPLSTVQEALTPTVHTVPTTLSTTPSTTTTQDDVNRSSKSRHDFSDEDVEYMTDTEIQPVQTYALFVNDAPEESVKTAEEVIVQETFKKYANAFPVETALPGDLPSLRKRSSKKKSLKSSARSSGSSKISKRGQTSSEEDEDEEDEEDDEPTSTSLEETADKSSGFRIENPYPGYRVNKGGIVDDEKSVESAEPNSGAVKESTEGILPTLVQKEKPKNKDDDEEDEEDEESEESAEDDLELNEHDGDGLGVKGAKLKKSSKYTKSNNKKKATGQSNKPSLGMDDEDSSEEDEVADDQQAAPPPWAPVYSMYMKDKKNKQGYTKKQKGPYKGGEGPYADSPSYHTPQASSSSLTSFLKKPWGGSNSASQEIPGAPPTQSHETGAYPDYHNQHFHGGPPGGPAPFGASQEAGALPEQKPGFFQSIMSWFTGGSKASEQADPNGYGAGPYGAPGGQHGLYGGHGGHGSIEHDEPQKDLGGAGSPWPSQPDPAGVGHFGQTYNYRGYRHPEASSEEEEELLDEPTIISKKERKNKRRYRGRSDSIITTPPKKSAPPKKSNSGPPPPVVVIPKDSKSVAPAGSPPVSAYEPNHQYEKLIQADGGLTTVNNAGKKVVVVSSQKENKRAKKAAVKPKNKNQKKKSQKQRERASRESSEDDDEAFSSEELYNQQVAKMKSGTSSVTLDGNNNGNNHNSGGSYSVNKQNDQSSSTKPTTSFHSHFESMFGTEEKDKYKIKGNDDGSLLYGFDSLSSTLHAAPELPITPGKKKPSSYKVNKNKKKKKGQQQPVKFNNKEVIESSEEEEEKKKKRK